MLIYRESAQLPAGWPTGSLPAGSTAAAQSNPLLRADKHYEPLTDAIAARYGLTIARQIYLGDIRCASFDVPGGLSSAGVLQRIRSEAAAFVAHALYSPLKRARHIPDDPDFLWGPTGPQWSHWQIGCPAAWDITQ